MEREEAQAAVNGDDAHTTASRPAAKETNTLMAVETTSWAQADVGTICDRGEESMRGHTTRALRRVARKQLALEQKRADAAGRSLKTLALLSPTEIVDRLRIYSTGLIEDIHALVLRQIQAEDQRESRLDAKAQGLLVTSGLSLTVAFTFGGILLQHPEYFASLGLSISLGSWPIYAVVIFYGIALVAGLLSSIYAVRALIVTDDYRATSERDVLDETELSAADEEYSKQMSKIDGDLKLANDSAQARFRRHMTAHYWQIWQQHSRLHDRKATIIGRGQRLFLVFLSALIIIGVAMGFAALIQIR